MRVEVVIFAQAEPVNRETLVGLVGKNCAKNFVSGPIRTSTA